MRFCILSCLLFLSISPIRAQHLVSIRAGLITYAHGEVFLDGKPFEFTPDRMKELPKGQRLRTDKGRVEVQLGPGATLWMEENSVIRMIDPVLTDTQIQFEQGKIIVEVIDNYKNDILRIHLGKALIEPKKVGLYLVSSHPSRTYVFHGKAEVQLENGKKDIKAGHCANLDKSLGIKEFDPEWSNPFYSWTMQRSDIIYGKIKLARIQEQALRQMENSRFLREVELQTRRMIQQQEEQQRLLEEQQRIQQQLQLQRLQMR